MVEPLEWLDTPLVMYCSAPLDRLLGRSSKYVEMWTVANGGKPVKRRDRLTPTIFQGYWIAEERKRETVTEPYISVPTVTGTVKNGGE